MGDTRGAGDTADASLAGDARAGANPAACPDLAPDRGRQSADVPQAAVHPAGVPPGDVPHPADDCPVAVHPAGAPPVGASLAAGYPTPANLDVSTDCLAALRADWAASPAGLAASQVASMAETAASKVAWTDATGAPQGPAAPLAPK